MQLMLEGAKARAQTLALFVGSIWVVSLAGFVFHLQHALGVQPRTLTGLTGIATAPWAHANLAHLVSNTVPLLVLGWLAMLPKQEGFWQALLGGTLGAGALAWLMGGAHTVHMGASGVVFGLFGFIVARGFYTRRVADIAVAVPTAALYGISMLLGVLPVYPGVSWQSHLGGAIGGVLAARFFSRTEK
jgi:membrane associated rhomboid family serine protease